MFHHKARSKPGAYLETELAPVNIDDAPPIPKLIDVPAVCAITSLSVSRIYALIAEGQLRRVKIGRKTLFVEAEIRDFINRQIAASPLRQQVA
jgi:excisionase family DNA binding protein